MKQKKILFKENKIRASCQPIASFLSSIFLFDSCFSRSMPSLLLFSMFTLYHYFVVSSPFASVNAKRKWVFVKKKKRRNICRKACIMCVSLTIALLLPYFYLNFQWERSRKEIAKRTNWCSMRVSSVFSFISLDICFLKERKNARP